jgi:acyl homoserine lactone synthase
MRNVSIGEGSRMFRSTLASMHHFRHEVFIRRLGWALPSIEGAERDQYDRPDTTYFVVGDAEHNVTACARLLPTTRSYMLPELFPQLLGELSAPCDVKVWELSRFAAEVSSSGTRVLSLSEETLQLLEVILEFSRERAIERLILVTSVGIERLLLRAKLQVHRFAAPARIDGNLCAALYIDVAASLQQLRMRDQMQSPSAAAPSLRLM